MDDSRELHVVTGALGYSGRYIAERLIAQGHRVRTITNSVDRHNPFGDRLEVHPFNFDQPEALAESLRGASVLYNTYWVRFNHKLFKHQDAVANTLTMFNAAKSAGVQRVVHVSITNPDETSHLEYFSGKGRLERGLRESGLSHAILRPAVIFGAEDILINNIAWMLRTFPIFGYFGNGEYRLEPIHVEDLADLAVKVGSEKDNVTIDAVGPECFSYKDLARELAIILGVHRPMFSMPAWLGYWGGKLVGWLKGDVLITREEIDGLMADLLYTGSPPAGQRKLTDWARANVDTLGKHYASELARRRERRTAYIPEHTAE